jgi:hypothetical protein
LAAAASLADEAETGDPRAEDEDTEVEGSSMPFELIEDEHAAVDEYPLAWTCPLEAAPFDENPLETLSGGVIGEGDAEEDADERCGEDVLDLLKVSNFGIGGLSGEKEVIVMTSPDDETDEEEDDAEVELAFVFEPECEAFERVMGVRAPRDDWLLMSRSNKLCSESDNFTRLTGEGVLDSSGCCAGLNKFVEISRVTAAEDE